MKVHVEYLGSREMEMEDDSPVYLLLRKMGINRETVLVLKRGEVIHEEDSLSHGDKIKIISVVSGG